MCICPILLQEILSHTIIHKLGKIYLQLAWFFSLSLFLFSTLNSFALEITLSLLNVDTLQCSFQNVKSIVYLNFHVILSRKILRISLKVLEPGGWRHHFFKVWGLP